MKKEDLKQRLQREIDDWRTRLGELRVQASLGRMELRDKKAELERTFERARAEANDRIADLRRSGGQEIETLAKSIEAGWDELRKTYSELSARKDPKKK